MSAAVFTPHASRKIPDILNQCLATTGCAREQRRATPRLVKTATKGVHWGSVHPMTNASFPNWFASSQSNFSLAALLNIDILEPVRCLQIGVFTGDASQWIAEHLLVNSKSILDDVDTWEGSDEEAHHVLDFASVEDYYQSRMKKWITSGQVRPHKMTSRKFFTNRDETGNYDFIYIDGDHTALSVLNDAVDADRCLKVGGVLAFDDYMWSAGKERLDDPRPAIDVFLDIYGPYYEPLIQNHQVWLRKKSKTV